MTKKELRRLLGDYVITPKKFEILYKKVNSKKEIWKSIKGYEGIYQISNFGRIKRLGYSKYSHKDKYRLRHRDEIIIKPRKCGVGYVLVTLSKQGIKQHFSLHRLVAIHFIRNVYNKREVNHKYGNKKNNMWWNLEWSTRSDNIKHSHKNGFHPSQKQKLTSQSRVTYQYSLKGDFINKYPSQTIASVKSGVPRNNIWQCINGYQKTAGGYVWK